jgi:DNA-binding NarL/FixJ family response regulator
MIRIVICDDSRLFREALTGSLEQFEDLDVVASVTTVDEAIEQLRLHTPDVALVDVRVGEESGVRVAQWVRANQPSCRVVVMSAYESDLALADSYAASASAFVLKDVSCAVLVARVRDAAAGIRRICEEDARAARRRLDERGLGLLGRLRQSDRHLVTLISRGMTDRDIAAVMGLSVQTIRNRVSKILNELRLENRVQIAVLVTRSLQPVESR